MNRIITATFANGSRYTVTAEKYQFDYGQILVFPDLELPQSYEVHFSNKEAGGIAYTSIGDENGVAVPDLLLQTGLPIYAWMYLHDAETDGETVYRIKIPIVRRSRQVEEPPTVVQQSVITQAIAALNVAVEKTGEDVTKAQNAANAADGSAEDSEAYAKGTRDGAAVGSSDPAYHNNSKYYSEQSSGSATAAGNSATAANGSAEDAEAYAKGTRGGIPVGTSDPAYQNNAKYFAEQAEEIVQYITDVAPKYGVSGVGGSSTTLTRLWDAVGKTVTPGTDAVQCESDFDGLQPFARRKCVGTWTADPLDPTKAVFTVGAYQGNADYTEDGSMGDFVAVEVNPFYYIKDDENGIWGVSPGPQSGWSIHPICLDNDGNVRAKTYIPVYQLALKNGHAVSLPGYHPEFGAYKALCDAARTYGSGSFTPAMLETSALQDYEELLVTIEFASTNIPDNFINGAMNLPYAAGNKVSLSTTDENYVVVPGSVGDLLVVGNTIYIGETYSTTPADASAYNIITAIEKCDASGTLDESGSYRKITFSGDARSTTADTTTISARPWLTGGTNGAVPGVNPVKGHTGSPVTNSTGKYPFRYRWRENIWGNINRTLYDLMNARIADGSSYHLDWYFLADPTKWTPKNAALSDLTSQNGWEKLGVTTPVESYADGYIKEYGHDSQYPHVRVPVWTKNGSATTYYSDYAYLVSSAAVRAVRAAGLIASGYRSHYGPFYRNAYYAPSHSIWYFGGALFPLQ